MPTLPEAHALRSIRAWGLGDEGWNERFLRSGLAGFTDHEIMELLLTLATPCSDVKMPARALLERFGGLRGVLDAPLSELQSVDGVGSVTAVVLHEMPESVKLYLRESSEGPASLREVEHLSGFCSQADSLPETKRLRELVVTVVGRAMFAARDQRETTMSRAEIRQARDEGRA